MDKEFAEAFKEEIELTEMKWEVGGVYHQEFKNGDKVYFRPIPYRKIKDGKVCLWMNLVEDKRKQRVLPLMKNNKDGKQPQRTKYQRG